MNELVYLTGTSGDIRAARGKLFVPVVAVREGVLHAINAPTPEYVPLTTLRAYPSAWDGKPVTLGHPFANGQQISADDPRVLEASGLGTIQRARVEDRALHMELYIDEERAQRIGAGRLLERLRAGEKCEVSIGAFVRTSPRIGTFNGKPYQAVWTSLKPDHLALLEHHRGACSCSDGCGTYQRAAEAYAAIPDPYAPALAKLRAARATPEQTFADQYRAARLAALAAEYASWEAHR